MNNVNPVSGRQVVLVIRDYICPLHPEPWPGRIKIEKEWWFWGFLESGIEIVVRIWLHTTACDSLLTEMRWKIRQLPDLAGVEITLPQRVIRYAGARPQEE